MSINEVKKGQTPTLLEANKANELIQAINSISNMEVTRGEEDKFVFGVSKSILQILEREEEGEGGSLSGFIINNQDVETENIHFLGKQSVLDETTNVRIERIDGEETTLVRFHTYSVAGNKGKNIIFNSPNDTVGITPKTSDQNQELFEIQLESFSLNGKKLDTTLAGFNETIKVLTYGDNLIALQGLTLNGIKAKDATISCNQNDQSIEVTSNTELGTIILKGLTLNGIKAKDATIKSIDESTEVSADDNSINLKTLTLNNIKAKDATLKSDDASVTVNSEETSIDLKALTLNGIKAKDSNLISSDSTVGISVDGDNIDLKATGISVGFEGRNGIKVTESVDGNNKTYTISFDCNQNPIQLQAGDGIEIVQDQTNKCKFTISSPTPQLDLESGEYVPMMICNDGAVKTIMVKDWSYTPEEEEEGEGG